MTNVADLTPAVERELLPDRGRPGRLAQRLWRYVPAIALFIMALVVWEVVCDYFKIQTFLLPKPSLIAATFIRELPVISLAGFFTLREAVGGFVLGCTLAIVVALATSRWTIVSEGVMPFAIAVNSTPIVAVAPIMNNWFGITNPVAKMSIVAVIVFFPVMINMVRGLTQVNANSLELMRSCAAGDFTVLVKLRIPNSMPYLFSAFKVSSTLSIIGAVVSEYFGGSRDALGVYISQQAALFHFAEAWAAIIIACIMGIAFYAVLLIIERLVMPWHVSMRAVEN
ncbi:MAG: ABC transporter permease [Chloroflexi bacterium]|nr:ABC transporter permease [Chloroflexota bacterium]